MRRELLIVVLFVLALRLPFLNQPIQGDDVNYLYGAEYAQIDPLHPTHARYAFLGRLVDMRGHPHPPLNAWILGALLAGFRDVSEIPFHAAYIVFSLIAAWSALLLSRRFSPRPLAATLLFCATPAFVLNGTSLEADLPFVAFWLLAIALFAAAVDTRSVRLLVFSAVAMSLSALCAYQAVILTPILFAYLWNFGRSWRAAWIASFTSPVVIALWQLYERLSSGALPAAVLAGYMQSYQLQALITKLKSAAALTGHLAWLVFPSFWVPPLAAIPAGVGAAFYDLNPLFWGSIAVGLGILIWCIRHWRDFLCQWILIFFAVALVIFFAGSARYLLPIALPVAILATRHTRRGWLEGGFAAGLILSLALATVNYQHWNGYRTFAKQLAGDVASKRVWINGEWGLRYYFESEGALPLMQGQPLYPGDMVVSSQLGYPMPLANGASALTPVAERTITSRIPLRTVAVNGRAAYSAMIKGLRPFDISLAPIDKVQADLMMSRKPSLSDLLMNAPEAEQQIVSGVYQLEGQWRWTAREGIILLKPPAEPLPLVVQFAIHEKSPARRVTVFLNGQQIASQTFDGPGRCTLRSPPMKTEGDSVVTKIVVDQTFSVPGDNRELGIILMRVGFQP